MLRYQYTGPFATYLKPNEQAFLDYGPGLDILTATQDMKIAPRDTWGNLRVPRLETVAVVEQSRGEWAQVPEITQPEQYSSLLGVPVIGLPSAKSRLATDFTIETSYMSLSCGPWETFPEGDERLRSYRKAGTIFEDPFRIKGSELTLHTAPDANTTFFMDGDMPEATLDNATAVARDPRIRQFYFVSGRQSANNIKYDLSATRCNISENHVEARVYCRSGRDCSVTRLRRSLVDTRPTTSSPFDDVWRKSLLIQTMPFMMTGTGAYSSSIEIFLRDSVSATKLTSNESFVNLSEVPPDVFSRRLAIVLNDWLRLSMTYSSGVAYGDNPSSPSDYGFDFGGVPANGSVPQSVIEKSCQLMCTQGTEATLTHTVQVFSFSEPWLALLFASSTVLLLTGLAGSVLSLRTRVPDILGYVTSMTYNNRYLRLPEQGGVLDATHRARLLRDLHISVSDVEGGNSIGRIAFTSETRVRALEKGRKYV
jgi:hypothetical protein